jgi:hypothetical protein
MPPCPFAGCAKRSCAELQPRACACYTCHQPPDRSIKLQSLSGWLSVASSCSPSRRRLGQLWSDALAAVMAEFTCTGTLAAGAAGGVDGGDSSCCARCLRAGADAFPEAPNCLSIEQRRSTRSEEAGGSHRRERSSQQCAAITMEFLPRVDCSEQHCSRCGSCCRRARGGSPREASPNGVLISHPARIVSQQTARVQGMDGWLELTRL